MIAEVNLTKRNDEDKHQSGIITDASMLAKTIEILKKEGGNENAKG